MSTEGATGNSETRTFATLQAFARAISHAVRTPLAVISNDLHYLAGRDDSGVAGVTAAQCRRIVSILDLAGSLGAGRCISAAISLAELGRELSTVSMPLTIEGDTTAIVSVDRARFPQMLRLAAALTSDEDAASLVALRGEAAGLRCVARHPRKHQAMATECPTNSLCDRWPDRIEAPLLDVLVEAHGGTFESISRHEIVFVLPEPRR